MEYLVDCESVWTDIHRTYLPPPKLTVSEWADQHGVVVNGAERGRWTTRPPQKAILDAWNQPEIEWIKLMKSARVGYTSIIGQVIAYHIAQNPCPQMMVQPTVEDAEGWSKDDLQPLLDDTPELRGKVKEARSRDSASTIKKKSYPGGPLHIVGANSARGFRRISVHNVFFDEVDGYPQTAGHEGDQIGLGAKRADDYHDRKLSIGSTPTDDLSRMQREINDSSRGYYFVPCPDCGKYHIRKFREPKSRIFLRGEPVKVSFLQWPDGEPSKAKWVCPDCGVLIGHAEHRRMMRLGYWKGEDWSYRNGKYKFLESFTGSIGFDNYWSGYGYSPNSTPAKLATDFLKVKSNPDKLKTFVNTALGEVFSEGEEIDTGLIEERKEKYKAEVPMGALVLTAGIDVQADRVEFEVVGWSEEEESWNVDYQILYGDVGLRSFWDEEVATALRATYTHESGRELSIAGMVIDTGYLSSVVFGFVERFRYQNLFPGKGVETVGKEIVEDRQKRALRLRKRSKKGHAPEIIGVNEAKTILHRRLTVKKPGPGYCHFPDERDSEYFEQLTAEKLIEKHVKGRTVQNWVKVRPRNEAMDCRNYAQAALRLLNVNWNKVRETFKEKEEPAPEKVAPTTRRKRPTRKRKNWVTDI